MCIQTIEDTRRRLQVATIAGCDVTVDWSMISHNNIKYHDLFVLLEDKKSIVAWKEHEQIAQSQVGDVAMMAAEILLNYTKPPSKDRDLGRTYHA